jgi:tetratricopeptide (TPR) repeat protein
VVNAPKVFVDPDGKETTVKHSLRTAVFSLVLGTCLLLIACDRKADPPRTGFLHLKTIKSVDVDPSDDTEVRLVTALDQSRQRYLERLQVLRQYYASRGYVEKINWSYREMENLQDAQAFTWTGITVPGVVDTPLPEGSPEALYVERVLESRQRWLNNIDALATYYSRSGQELKREAADSIRTRFDPVHTYLYLDSAEFPPLTLQASEIIPEAQPLYDQAVSLFKAGKGITHTALSTDYDKQRQALLLFKQLINDYPSSSLIGMSAYYIAEIYKEYFNEDFRAVKWYERAYTWQPGIREPARFQAATVYDLRLNDKVKAIDLYQAVLDHEHFNPSNRTFARRRIPEIYEEAQAQARRLEQMGLQPR